jgi:hypothetical protein
MAVFPVEDTSINFDDLSRMADELDRQNIPQEGRVMLVSPDVARKLRESAERAPVDYFPIVPSQQDGQHPSYIGTYGGIDIKIDASLPPGTALEAHTPLYASSDNGKT